MRRILILLVFLALAATLLFGQAGRSTQLQFTLDKMSITGIFNLMMTPAVLKTPDTYDYVRDRTQISHDLGGIHFVYITLWPDSRVRTWLENDLERVNASTPVFIFAHVFVRAHSNITAYFHGHSNWNQFYDWTGPNHTVALHSFRVDSPMKGKFSNPDESKLSFQIATIDTASRSMTVREVLWNADPQHPEKGPAWGVSTTVALFRR